MNSASIKNVFSEIDGGSSKHGIKAILQNEVIIDTLKEKYQILPQPYVVNNINAPFDFPVEATGDKVLLNQKKYFIFELTFQEQCNECGGTKYVTCPDPDCKGQHIYECTECKGTRRIQCNDCRGTGWNKCPECGGSGDKKCSTCKGRGEIKCSRCHGDGIDNGTIAGNFTRGLMKGGYDQKHEKCKKCGGKGYQPCPDCRDGFVRCENCNGKGEVRCETCAGRGEVDCPTCEATGKLTCDICYGDKERYGMVDCPTCKAQGIMAQIAFVETTVNNNLTEKLFHTGDQLINLEENIIFSTQPNREENTIPTLINVNENNKEFYDEYSRKYGEIIQEELGYSLTEMPKITNEEMNYQIIPCVQFKYKHMLTNTMHEATIINFFKKPEVIFHEKAEEVKKDLGNATKAVGGLFGKLLRTKGFKSKEDKKNEITLMIYLAKADGVIEEDEKITLSEVISSLEAFTAGEKQEIFNLMNLITLPELTEKQTTFSSKDKANEVISNLEKLASVDGEIEGKEKALIEKVKSMIKYKG